MFRLTMDDFVPQGRRHRQHRRLLRQSRWRPDHLHQFVSAEAQHPARNWRARGAHARDVPPQSREHGKHGLDKPVHTVHSAFSSTHCSSWTRDTNRFRPRRTQGSSQSMCSRKNSGEQPRDSAAFFGVSATRGTKRPDASSEASGARGAKSVRTPIVSDLGICFSHPYSRSGWDSSSPPAGKHLPGLRLDAQHR